MRGLAAEEIYNRTILENKDFRIDSSFYTSNTRINESIRYEKIGSLLKESQYGLSISMNENKEGYPIYRMNEIHNMMCDIDVNKYAIVNDDILDKFNLNDRDVLFNRTNSYEWVGRTGLYRKIDRQNFIFASYLVRFVPNQEYLVPEYLVAYLNTKYGIAEVKRRSRHSINQTNVNPEEVKEIYIPLLSIHLQYKIQECFEKAHLKRLQAINLYQQATMFLSKTIGLTDFTPSISNARIENFNNSFIVTGRLDAEYYQPKYTDYLRVIRDYKNGWGKLGDICDVKDTNFVPINSNTYQYIELANIGESGEINDCTIAIGSELPTRARREVHTGDVIVSSIEGSLESCALVQEDYNGALCSTGFYIVNSQKINSETLLVLFKSELMQSILKQRCSGTILTAINKDEFLNIPIPLIEEDIQQEVQEKVSESFMLRRDSENILGIAKRAVEIAIEKGEEQSLEFIKINTD